MYLCVIKRTNVATTHELTRHRFDQLTDQSAVVLFTAARWTAAPGRPTEPSVVRSRSD